LKASAVTPGEHRSATAKIRDTLRARGRRPWGEGPTRAPADLYCV